MNKGKQCKLGITALCGLGIGLINGFFGAGGGVLAVECMTRLGVQEKQAHTSAILAILPLSVASAILYFISGHIAWEASVLWLLLGGAVGGLLGALLLRKLPGKWVNWLFTALILASGIRMVLA